MFLHINSEHIFKKTRKTLEIGREVERKKEKKSNFNMCVVASDE